MRINQVEELVQISKKNIRFYEEEGLLKINRKAENGYRDYTEEDVKMLQKIKLLRSLSIPIEEISKLQKGYLTLDDCLKRHQIFLEREQKNIDQKIIVCEEISSTNESFENLDPIKYLSHIDEMKKKGVRFMDVSKTDKKEKVPYLAAFVMIVMMLCFISLLLWGQKVDPIPLPVIAFLILMPVAVIVGVLLALKQRIKEIEKGEEYVARKY